MISNAPPTDNKLPAWYYASERAKRRQANRAFETRLAELLDMPVREFRTAMRAYLASLDAEANGGGS